MKWFIWKRWYETGEIFALIMHKNILVWVLTGCWWYKANCSFPALRWSLGPFHAHSLLQTFSWPIRNRPFISPCLWMLLIKKNWPKAQQKSGTGKHSPLLWSRFNTRYSLQFSCGGFVPTVNSAFPSITLSITQEKVSYYNLSDILVYSTVPMFFQC